MCLMENISECFRCLLREKEMDKKYEGGHKSINCEWTSKDMKALGPILNIEHGNDTFCHADSFWNIPSTLQFRLPLLQSVLFTCI